MKTIYIHVILNIFSNKQILTDLSKAEKLIISVFISFPNVHIKYRSKNVLNTITLTRHYTPEANMIKNKGRNSVMNEQLKKSSLYPQLRTKGDGPRRFQYHPLKTVGGVVFTQKFYIHK